jgi:hypothetical protein
MNLLIWWVKNYITFLVSTFVDFIKYIVSSIYNIWFHQIILSVFYLIKFQKLTDWIFFYFFVSLDKIKRKIDS